MTEDIISRYPPGTEPVKEDLSSLYHNTLQGKPIHSLIASSNSPQNMQIDAITHAGIINNDGVQITVDENAIQAISPQTFKALIIFITQATANLPRGNAITAEAIQRGRIVRMTLQDYMEECGIKDIKNAREQMNDAIRNIYSISLEWDETGYEIPEGKSRKVKVTKHHRMRITDHTITPSEGNPVKRGVAEIRLSCDMAEYLSNAYIMPYHRNLLMINTKRNPHSFSLGWKLCALHNMNFGNPKRANETTVSTLLRAATGIPRYETIADTGQIYNRIIKPFDRDMRALVEEGILSCYWYYNDLGLRIEGDQLGGLSYTDFSQLSVHYELNGYPDQTPRLEERSKRISAAIGRAKARKKKKESQESGAE